MTNNEYDGIARWNWVRTLRTALRDRAIIGLHIERYGWDDLPADYKLNYPERDFKQYRTWFKREIDDAEIHTAVHQAVLAYPPANWHLLVLEWPHAAESDPSRIAYTRSDAHGYADRQTITSVGKYLARHFPTMPDHKIRDIVMRHGTERFELWDTVSKIVYSVQAGPKSCMRWDDNTDSDTHPYEVYDPRYGWRAAVRMDGTGKILGRCLVNVEDMTFVRSYAHREGSSYSQSDEALEVWLRDQGYSKTCNWTGRYLKYLTAGRYQDDFWAPYLDGDEKHVSLATDDSGNRCLLVDERGDYLCERQDGHADGASGCDCNDCGRRTSEDDSHSIGYMGDYMVGDCCIDDYRWVLGRHGNEYYMYRHDAVYVESQDAYYDPDALNYHGIIQLDSGDYIPQDDAVYLDYRSIWVESDDDCWVHCEHTSCDEHVDDCVQLADGDWALENDAWQCEHDDAWYLNDEESFETECGKTIHPKHAGEYATNDEEN